MTIGLLSDTHGHLPAAVFHHFKAVDEIWHAGDFGTLAVYQSLAAFKPLRSVYGNVDGQEIRTHAPETNLFTAAGLKVMMKHIGGYPGRYAPGVKALIQQHRPALFISGHSHILKVQYDAALQCMHMNPGACGHQGWHKVKTLILFRIEGLGLHDLRVIELAG